MNQVQSVVIGARVDGYKEGLQDGMELAAKACDDASGLLTGEKAVHLHMMAKQIRILARKHRP